MTSSMKLGDRLRLLRKEHRLTLRELKERADISVPYLSDMERGVVNPSIETLQKVAKAYRMTLKNLFIGVKGMGNATHETYPDGFAELLEDPDYKHELNDDWQDLLLRIDFRGKRPSSKREWVELYLNLRRLFPQRGTKMQLSVNDMRTHVLELVRDTVKKYASTSIPKFEEIQAGLGLEAKEVELRPEVDGILAERTILVNSRIQNEERKQFTRFHEITHHLINEDGELISDIHDATLDQESEYKRQLERLCNIGAAEFLMPSKEFMKLSDEKGFSVGLIPIASRHFGSSAIATTIQLTQIAPNSCISAICEYGFVPNKTTPSQGHLLDNQYPSPQPTLHVAYSASSPTMKYWLAKYTNIPDDHLIHQAFLQSHALEGESYVLFGSGNQMPCHCEALRDKDRVYVLFHLTPLPNPDQLTLI